MLPRTERDQVVERRGRAQRYIDQNLDSRTSLINSQVIDFLAAEVVALCNWILDLDDAGWLSEPPSSAQSDQSETVVVGPDNCDS